MGKCRLWRDGVFDCRNAIGNTSGSVAEVIHANVHTKEKLAVMGL
jgi:hypothetical protein